ncbi:MAG: hypothetical protein AN483_11315 [Aphanizomenon flos-aquae MDT14a]|nr:MAG: hypothetical protein AN483_11315 [Aphanizomenon flos-aquae MDT14a]
MEGVRSLFGKWRECDRCLGSGGSAIAVWEVEGMRSLFGKLRDAIAVWGVEGVRFFASLLLCDFARNPLCPLCLEWFVKKGCLGS